MNELGEISLSLSLVVVVYSAFASFFGGAKNNEAMIRSGQNAFFSAFALYSIAGIALMYALMTRDFSVEYVYNYSNRDLNKFYTFSAFWAGQKGSLLLWAWMLGLFGSIAILQNRHKNSKIIPYAVGFISITMTLFSVLMVHASPVFQKLPELPADGHGLNPMLQNPGMIFHPPTLYVGFVAFTIPFAFAMAALLRRQEGEMWIVSTRRWTIFAWFFLTMGNLLGANWAYVELGWGGYWAWDPVENASFMPWLVGTAYLHSVMVQERKGMLKIWNVSLVTITFCLTIFGTFITRSGLISSVHSFGETTVGYYFLAFLIMVIIFSVWLIYSRRELLRSDNNFDSIISRESSFLFNNLALLGAAFAVLWGTSFPMISEMVRGVKITVGPPFFNKVMPPIALALLILTGICPLIAWRKATFSNFKRNFMAPFLTALVSSVAMIAAGLRDLTAWLFFTVSVFVLATIAIEFWRGVKMRLTDGNENPLSAAFNLVNRNRRRYGGFIIHVGAVCMFIGFTGNMFNDQKELAVKVGESFTVKDYKLTYVGAEYNKPKSTKDQFIATVLVEKDGNKLGYMRPEKNIFSNYDMPNSEVSIVSTLKEDLYLVFLALDGENTATFKAHINPLVKWLWIGGMVMGIGTLIAMLPDRREKKFMQSLMENKKA
ncbi:MAG: heme lyase CcmF/NrfE family subunit [Nitrospinae bacterium]|nr:heme lyase CcmF/NrfE family subunit [Nitrospinota bacterium]